MKCIVVLTDDARPKSQNEGGNFRSLSGEPVTSGQYSSRENTVQTGLEERV